MDGETLLHTLQGSTEFETAGDAPTAPEGSRRVPQHLRDCVTYVTAGNRKMPVLKTMVTTACERDCFYCPFRAGRGAMRRVRLSPDDLASGFMALYRAGAVEGLFLSSGIMRGGVSTQDSIIDTGTILREKYSFSGYMHLKIMPGAERDQIARLMQLADRVSVNLEAPNDRRLPAIAPAKAFRTELLTRLQWVEELRQQHGPALRASSSTEFVVGPAGESDLELLQTTQALHRQAGLARAYFAAFHPVVDTPLDNHPATGDTRRIRLYQASFLLRDYGFDVEDLPFEGPGNLPLGTDPKRAWAQQHLQHSPLEINTAEPDDLIRVPGIGPRSAARIVAARRQARLRTLHDLRAAGVRQAQRAAPYILLDGRRAPFQPRLF